jgi:hypothetical protein
VFSQNLPKSSKEGKNLAATISPKRKALFIKGVHDAEKLIRIAKCEAAKTGLRGKINVLDLGHYIPHIEGQAVIVEEAGSEYTVAGSGNLKHE